MKTYKPGETYMMHKQEVVYTDGKRMYSGSGPLDIMEIGIKRAFRRAAHISHFIVTPIKYTYQEWPQENIFEEMDEIIYRRES